MALVHGGDVTAAADDAGANNSNSSDGIIRGQMAIIVTVAIPAIPEFTTGRLQLH